MVRLNLKRIGIERESKLFGFGIYRHNAIAKLNGNRIGPAADGAIFGEILSGAFANVKRNDDFFATAFAKIRDFVLHLIFRGEA